MKLSELIKQSSFSSTAEKTFLNILATSNWMSREVSQLMEEYGLSMPQYNVLRILRGSHPEAMNCGQIKERLLDRTPDVTRLLDRLEKDAYVTRSRWEQDRRIRMVHLTDAGLKLLTTMDEDVEAVIERLNRHLSPEERSQLSELLEKMRTDQKPGLQ